MLPAAVPTLQASDLYAIERPAERRFVIMLNAVDDLHVEAVVRVVKHRRVVVRAVWQSRPVYAKLFIGRDAARYAERDRRGAQALADAGVMTPALLYAAALPDSTAHVLLYAAVSGAMNADQAWNSMDSAQRSRLAFALVREVALHHQAGLQQTDLYLKNFMLQGDTIYTLDGDGIRDLPSWFTRRAALRNLAMLLGKLDVLEVWPVLPGLLDQYARLRGWECSPALGRFKRMVAAQRYHLAQGYAQRKVLRQCSDVNVQVSSRKFLAISSERDTPALRFVLQAPDLCMGAEHVRLKSGNTCTVSLISLGEEEIVVKRYNIKNFWHGLNRALRKTRAAASWSNAFRLQLLGVATPSPVALLERRTGCIRHEAYFLAEYLHAPDVAEYFAAPMEQARRDASTLCIARLFYQLYLLMIEHGDCKASNIKIADDQPVLIDLDSMRQYAPGWLGERRFLRGHVRDLRRFLRNWSPGDAVRVAMEQAFVMTYKDPVLLRAAGIHIEKDVKNI